MKSILLCAMGLCVTALSAGFATANTYWPSMNSTSSTIEGAGRNIMRTAEGGIVAAFGAEIDNKSKLVFSQSVDNGKTWNSQLVDDVRGEVIQVAIDSNFQGSYVAFTETNGDSSVGKIAYFASPFANDPQYVLSAPITPKGVKPRDTFIQASRAGWGDLADKNRETVVYGWQDAHSKGLYIGVSLDGRTFPMAKLVVKDSYATSGPAVAIRGDYVIATYLTTNSAMTPRDIPEKIKTGKSFPAWIESNDAGATWSTPKPLFGTSLHEFPTVDIDMGSGDVRKVRLAGGTNLPNSPILNWATSRDVLSFVPNLDKSTPFVNGEPIAQIDKLGGTTFVQTSMTGIDAADEKGEVSIVSFRSILPGAEWTHVIANNKLTSQAKNQDIQTSVIGTKASQFQYSALIDTAVRATVYKEYDDVSGMLRLVAAVSTDTGKNFKQHLSFNQEQLAALGVKNFTELTIFSASQCLFEDRNGDVYIDIIVVDEAAMHYARVPIGVNAADLRVVQ